MTQSGVHRRSQRLITLALVDLLVGCTASGTVNLSWEFVDRDGDKIFPGGLFDRGRRDACGFPGLLGDENVSFDLGISLEICDTACEEGCDDPACLVTPPQFADCRTFRASDPDVPAADHPYLFTLHPVLSLGATTCEDPSPSCIAVPGPRERTVERGRTVDLQVYQIVVNIDLDGNDELDLDACGCGA